MTIGPVFFGRPESTPIRLRMPPRLASWNAAGHPDQVRLAAALADAEELLAPQLARLRGPVALRLDVGLPSTVPLLAAHDLDNYLFPLAAHVTGRLGAPLMSVSGTKQHSPESFVCIAPAVAAAVPSADVTCEVRTTASATTPAFKQEISDQLAGAAELPPGPVALELAFAVGTGRNWLNLWKQTIDSLDRLLGRTQGTRAWHPQDGRITKLGLHCTIDDALGHDVLMRVAARSLAP